jgi:hypothetical protein
MYFAVIMEADVLNCHLVFAVLGLAAHHPVSMFHSAANYTPLSESSFL